MARAGVSSIIGCVAPSPPLHHLSTPNPVQVEVLCRVVYVDYEGLADGRSVKNMVQTLAPKMLIVAAGSRSAKAELVTHVRKQLDGDNSAVANDRDGESEGAANSSAKDGGARAKAEAPRYVVVQKVLEPVPVALDSGACDVLLHDSLHTQLRWKQVGEPSGTNIPSLFREPAML